MVGFELSATHQDIFEVRYTPGDILLQKAEYSSSHFVGLIVEPTSVPWILPQR